MNTNTYNGTRDIPSLIPLGIAMDYRVKWSIHRIIRDFIQNFYDSIGYERLVDEFQYEWDIVEKDKTLHIRMRTLGHSFSYEWLTYIGGSTKTDKSGYAGEYGEGFKIALLCLMKLGGDAVMSSGEWELRPCTYTEQIAHQRISMFGYNMKKREDDGFTTLELYGIPASKDSVRCAGEAMLEFFYPQNPLFAEKIEDGKGYGLYARSSMKIPCTESGVIQGVFYYKYIARGRLPFPAVIHMTEIFNDFEHDRSREILSEATVVRAVYEMSRKLSPQASYWLLTQMKEQWQDLPVFEKERDADLNTWYYVICQLVRNISMESKWMEKFVQEYPMETYAYIERLGSDNGKNQLLREAKGWFKQHSRDGSRRRLVNPIFRLLGVSSILQEYMDKRDTLYRELNEKERERGELIRACARSVFPTLSHESYFPKILVCTGMDRKRQGCTYYGILPSAKAKISRSFSREDRKRQIRYRVEEVAMEEEDLVATAEFQKVLLKFISACVGMYGTERSGRSNGVLTYVGAMLYRSRNSVEKYEERWNQT